MSNLPANEFLSAGGYLIQLLKSAVNGTAPEEKAYTCSWEQVYAFAQKNRLVEASWHGVRRLKFPPPNWLMEKWGRAADTAVCRQLLFKEEREKIFQGLEKQGLSYILLKGDRLQAYYPHPGMRVMSDNDILYADINRPFDYLSAQKKMVSVMKGLGYTCLSLKGVDQPFWKAPCFHFEMHRGLVSPDSPYYEYYKNPWRRAIRNEKDPFCYSFPPEDEYIYFVMHTEKHFALGGAGIRGLLDLYVYLKAHTQMDWGYIQKQLSILNLLKFEAGLRALARQTFGTENLPIKDALFIRLINSGTYGSVDRQWKNDLDKLYRESGSRIAAKLRYIKKRLNPVSEVYEQAYPFFYRHKAARVFLPCARFFHALRHHPQNLIRELKALFSNDRR